MTQWMQDNPEMEPDLAVRARKGGLMRKLIGIAVVVVVGLVAYNYFQTGTFSILPGGSMSQEEHELNRLKGEFRRAAQEYRQAGRAAGVSGLDTTSDAEAALATVDDVERDLKALRKRTKDTEVQGKIDDLLAEIKRYKDTVG